MKIFGKLSEQTKSEFRTSGDNKQLTLDIPTSLTGASLTLTLPDVNGTADTIISKISSDTGTGRLKNKELDSATVLIVDNTDVTKKVAFSVSGVTTGVTRTLTVPNVSDTLVTLAASQALSNKTIDASLNTISNITNSEISGSAAIAYSKLSLSNSIVNSDINTSAAIAYSKLNLSLSIVNADINASAAIALSKLAAVTASKALVSDASGFVSASSVTSTELGYVSGVTSAIQTQINGKQNDVITTQGDLVIGNVSNVASRLAIGASGTILTSNGTTASWATPSGTGDVTAAANIADNRLVRGDGGAKGIQQSGITVDDSNNVSGVQILTLSNYLSLPSASAAGYTITAVNALQMYYTVSSGHTVTLASAANLSVLDSLIISGDLIVTSGNLRVI